MTRVVDAAARRLPLQRKVGAGLNLAPVPARPHRRHRAPRGPRRVGPHDRGRARLEARRVDETLEPAIAPRDLDTEYLRIPAGAAAGIHQSARGYRDGELAISLDLQMYVGAESPRDHVLIDGDPPIDATIAGGVAGDIATAAIAVNAIPKLLAAPAGLLTMTGHPARPPAQPPGPERFPPESAERERAGRAAEQAARSPKASSPVSCGTLRRRKTSGPALRARRRAAQRPLPARPHRQRHHQRDRGPPGRDAGAARAPVQGDLDRATDLVIREKKRLGQALLELGLRQGRPRERDRAHVHEILARVSSRGPTGLGRLGRGAGRSRSAPTRSPSSSRPAT